MERKEFLDKLRQSLENELSEAAVQENVNYYNSYIAEEVKNGRTEAEVVSELGDPWVIARSLIDAAENEATPYDGYDSSSDSSSRGSYNSTGGNIHVFGFDTWWKKLLLILGIIGVVMVFMAVLGGIFSIFAPIIFPLLIVIVFLRLLKNRRQ